MKSGILGLVGRRSRSLGPGIEELGTNPWCHLEPQPSRSPVRQASNTRLTCLLFPPWHDSCCHVLLRARKLAAAARVQTNKQMTGTHRQKKLQTCGEYENVPRLKFRGKNKHNWNKHDNSAHTKGRGA